MRSAFFLVSIVLVAAAQAAESSGSEIEPVRAIYNYKGPEGCTPETCSCTRSRRWVPGEPHVQYTTSCKKPDGTYVLFRIPKPFLSLYEYLKGWKDRNWAQVKYNVNHIPENFQKVVAEPKTILSQIWNGTKNAYYAAFEWGKPKRP